MYSLTPLWKSILVLIVISLPVYQAAADENKTPITITEVVKIITSEGYQDIRKIELSDDNDEYDINARDAKGKKVEIELNAFTGKITDIDND